MVNYLWPCFTLLLAVLLGQRNANFFLLIPGLLVSLFGGGWIFSEGRGLSIELIMANAAVNPLSYGLALTGAVVWAVYCCVVKRISKRADATALFFIATSLALWMKYLLSDYSVVSVRPLGLLELIGTATVMVLGYIGLDKGLSNGNLLFLAAVSYLAPVFFSLMSTVILSTSLQLYFWQGAILVTFGSLFCWRATRR